MPDETSHAPESNLAAKTERLQARGTELVAQNSRVRAHLVWLAAYWTVVAEFAATAQTALRGEKR
jgi:hypothetical protein